MLLRLAIACALAAAMTAAPAVADRGGVPHNGGGDKTHSSQAAKGDDSDEGSDDSGQSDRGATREREESESEDQDSDRGASHRKSGERHTSTSSDSRRPPHPEHSAPSQNTSPSSHSHAGKTTICHATHSETNPYVKITPSNNAIPAHDRHQDDEDIIPANGDCPGGTAKTHGESHTHSESGKSKSESKASHGSAGKTTICHATASVTNPFVRITISNNALAAHKRHQHGEDVVPANGDCPGGTQVAGSGQSGDNHEKSVAGNGTGSGPENKSEAAEDKAGEDKGAENETAENETAGDKVGEKGQAGGGSTGGVLGAHATGGSSAGAGTSGPSGTLAAEGSSHGGSNLPYTGWDLGIVAAVGAAMMLAGIALRRARRTSRARS